MRSRGGNIIPVLGHCVIRKVEIDGRNGGDGIRPHLLRMCRQGHTVRRVVASHMGNHRDTALGHSHNILQNNLPLLDSLVDALSGGTAHIQAVHALANQILRQCADSFGADGAGVIIAGIKCREDTGVFFVAH